MVPNDDRFGQYTIIFLLAAVNSFLLLMLSDISDPSTGSGRSIWDRFRNFRKHLRPTSRTCRSRRAAACKADRRFCSAMRANKDGNGRRPGFPDRGLEHFPAKWMPVRVAKMRQNKDLEPRSDSIGVEKALMP